jgi:hypothetical protein
MRWAELVARIRAMRNIILAQKPDEKRPLMRHRRRWEDNNKTDLKVDVDRIQLVK